MIGRITTLLAVAFLACAGWLAAEQTGFSQNLPSQRSTTKYAVYVLFQVAGPHHPTRPGQPPQPSLHQPRWVAIASFNTYAEAQRFYYTAEIRYKGHRIKIGEVTSSGFNPALLKSGLDKVQPQISPGISPANKAKAKLDPIRRENGSASCFEGDDATGITSPSSNVHPFSPACGANPRRIVFSVIVRGTRNCSK